MQNYSTIIGVLILRSKGESYDTIRRRYGIGNSTIKLIMNRFLESHHTLEELKGMPPADVEKLFYPPENLRDSRKPMPDFEKIYRRMVRMKRPDLAYFWLEYKEEHPDGYQLSQFYKLYRDFLKERYNQESVTMPVERIPGERMFIDWVGDKPMILKDIGTGDILPAHIFTTTLGFSSCVYAEVFPDEKLPNFLTGITHALEFYGAVPKYLVPDNLKTAVSTHTKDELTLNALFSDLEDFYDVITLPPPARKPKGKSTVENHVQILEVYLVEPLLSKGPYTSLDAVNKDVRDITAWINQHDFENKNDIRKTRLYAFETYDKPAMRPLPPGSFRTCDYKYFTKVPDNYHLMYDGHYYSVPYECHGKPAILKATMSEIRICDQNNTFICKHQRAYKEFPLYITEDSHMPEDHVYYRDVNTHNGDYYRRWAGRIGKPMEVLIDRVLRSAKHEEQAYNSCNGMLHMCDGVPNRLVNKAAQKCIDAEACKYSYFKEILKDIKNRTKSQTVGDSHNKLPDHKNIRGKENYK